MKKRVSLLVGLVAIQLGIVVIAIDLKNGNPIRLMALIPIAVGVVAIMVPRFTKTPVP